MDLFTSKNSAVYLPSALESTRYIMNTVQGRCSPNHSIYIHLKEVVWTSLFHAVSPQFTQSSYDSLNRSQSSKKLTLTPSDSVKMLRVVKVRVRSLTVVAVCQTLVCVMFLSCFSWAAPLAEDSKWQQHRRMTFINLTIVWTHNHRVLRSRCKP